MKNERKAKLHLFVLVLVELSFFLSSAWRLAIKREWRLEENEDDGMAHKGRVQKEIAVVGNQQKSETWMTTSVLLYLWSSPFNAASFFFFVYKNAVAKQSEFVVF